ncbi:MAG: (d)CMP kinase [Thiotrichaceae bacterium]|nr:(d)CMP kinase [Thiotrichaceae bacterium]
MIQPTIITIDGTAGSGKGTLAMRIATDLNWHLLDSGALYRLVAYAAIQQGIDYSDESGIERIAKEMDIAFIPTGGKLVEVLLSDINVSDAIRTEDCGYGASKVATYGLVRKALLQRQRDFHQAPGLVADGRDMGTVVFPNAGLKIYLNASAEIRAKRRQQQLKENGVNVNMPRLIRDIEERDARDMGRKDSPLKPADDAIVIDTDHLGVDEVYRIVLQKAQTLVLS